MTMYKNIKIKFTINKYRKYKPSNFNPKITNYWRSMYYDMFERWENKKLMK